MALVLVAAEMVVCSPDAPAPGSAPAPAPAPDTTTGGT